MWKLEGDGTPIQQCLEFSPDNRWLATIAGLGRGDGVLRVWGLVPRPEQCVVFMPDAERPLFRWIKFHPTNSELVAIMTDCESAGPGRYRVEGVWVARWKGGLLEKPTIGVKLPTTVREFDFMEGGSTFVAVSDPGRGGASLLRSDWTSGRNLVSWLSVSQPPRFGSDGRYFLTLDWWRAFVREVRPDEQPLEVNNFPAARNAMIHPTKPQMLDANEGRLRLRSLPEGELIGECELPGKQEIVRIAFSPQGHLAAVAHARDLVQIIDLESWRELAAYRWRVGNISALTFSPDGLRCAVAGNAGTIIVWDVE